MEMIQIPSNVRLVIEQFFTCEFTTLGKGGAPVSWPTLPMFIPAQGQFVIMTPLGLAQKTFNIRRDPRVSMLFSEPTGSGLDSPPAVLVQGEASVADRIFILKDDYPTDLAEAMKVQARKVLQRQPALDLFTGNPLARYLMDWYFMRLVITITPTRVRWWEGGAQAGAVSASGAIKGRGDRNTGGGLDAVMVNETSSGWQNGAPAGFPWGEFLKHRQGFASAVLSALDWTGYPASLRVRPVVGEGIMRLDPTSRPAADLDLRPGPACLLYHRHDGRLWNLKSFVVRGALDCDRRGWLLRPDKFIPGMGIGGLPSYIRFVADGRRNTCRYLEKRGLPRPQIPWDEVGELMKWAKSEAQE